MFVELTTQLLADIHILIYSYHYHEKTLLIIFDTIYPSAIKNILYLFSGSVFVVFLISIFLTGAQTQANFKLYKKDINKMSHGLTARPLDPKDIL